MNQITENDSFKAISARIEQNEQVLEDLYNELEACEMGLATIGFTNDNLTPNETQEMLEQIQYEIDDLLETIQQDRRILENTKELLSKAENIKETIGTDDVLFVAQPQFGFTKENETAYAAYELMLSDEAWGELWQRAGLKELDENYFAIASLAENGDISLQIKVQAVEAHRASYATIQIPILPDEETVLKDNIERFMHYPIERMTNSLTAFARDEKYASQIPLDRKSICDMDDGLYIRMGGAKTAEEILAIDGVIGRSPFVLNAVSDVDIRVRITERDVDMYIHDCNDKSKEFPVSLASVEKFHIRCRVDEMLDGRLAQRLAEPKKNLPNHDLYNEKKGRNKHEYER